MPKRKVITCDLCGSDDNSSAASPLRKGWVRRTFCQKYSLNYFRNYGIIET